jgi:plastocyanin
MRMRRTLIALALSTALLSGCGGDDEEEPAATPAATQEEPASGGGGGGGATVEVSSPADGSLTFDPSELTAKAGEVTFTYDNPSQVPHAFAIDDVEGATDTITESQDEVTVELEPGTYTYYCPVGSHRQAGMEGTLTVE